MPSESVHERLQRLGLPHVHLKYRVDLSDARVVMELPFVIGVMGDFTGDGIEELGELRDRRFRDINRDNFDDVLRHFRPSLNMAVDYKLGDNPDEMLCVSLCFESLEGFSPFGVVRQVPELKALLDHRTAIAASIAQLRADERGLQEADDKLRRQMESIRFPAEIQSVVDAYLARSERTSLQSPGALSDYVQRIDELLSLQLREILHHEKFQRLEGSWRGLHDLVFQTEQATDLQFRVLCCTKQELCRDLENAKEFDQSATFKLIYAHQFAISGRPPCAVIVGDYAFENNTDDLQLLEKLSNIAAVALCPFLTSPSPTLFGVDAWGELPAPREWARRWNSPKYIKWHALRKSEDSQFVALVLPRLLARGVYGAQATPVAEFSFEEFDAPTTEWSWNSLRPKLCWTSGAYGLARCIVRAYSQTGYCVRFLGPEDGRLNGLPFVLLDDAERSGAISSEMDCADPLAFGGTGFLMADHSDGIVFVSGETLVQTTTYDRATASVDAEAAACLSNLLAACRFGQFVKVMARNWFGRSLEPEDVEREVNRWIEQFVCATPHPMDEQKLFMPLKSARVEISRVDGEGWCYARISVCPWNPVRQLSGPITVITEIPTAGG